MMELKTFATAFLEPLASDGFTPEGSLIAYLSLPFEDRTGDEAEIVDMLVTTRLLTALGYVEGERGYNRHKDGSRPDFAVRIAEYPSRPCLIIEDKSTTESPLSRHKQQLENYLSSTHAPRGLLVNGQTILGYDNAGPSLVLTLSVSVVDLVSKWRGEGDLFSAGLSGFDALMADERRALAVLLQRYGRESFAGLQALIDDLTLQRPDQVDMIPVPHAADGSTWVAGRTRIPLVSAAGDPDSLTRAVRGLIVDLEIDVAVQFTAFRARYQEYLERARHVPGSDTPYDDRVAALTRDILQMLPPARATQEQRDDVARRIRLVLMNEAPPLELQAIRADVYGLLELSGTGTQGTLPAFERLIADVAQWAQRYAAHIRHLATGYGDALEVQQFYETWRRQTSLLVVQSADERRLQQDFFAQTAYLVITRMLLVRIIEDKGLAHRMFTNGGAAVWFRTVEPHYFAHAIGRSPEHLLAIAFQAAQQTYAHFYSEKGVFDWYRPDRNMIVRILHILAGFNVRDINHDIIGAVYGGYVEDEHKHESGLYYTPPAVIEHILDQIDYRGTRPLEGRFLDLSCGSGAFLVAAGRRLVEAHRAYWRARGEHDIPVDQIEGVIRAYRDTLFGIDINPFACALAELNLLIQVLDLIGRARSAGLAVPIDRFNVYNEDSLTVSAETRAVLIGSLPFPTSELPLPDQIKTGTGRFDTKFLCVVGNPPYVRADEGLEGLTEYRALVKANHPLESVRQVLVKKWDLFVPFVATGIELLAGNGRLGMIVSSAIENVPYAQKLRERLAESTTIKAMDFFPNVRLFEDAVVENTIIIVEAGSPDPDHQVVRRWHDSAPPSVYREQQLSQRTYGQTVFRQSLETLRIRDDVHTIRLQDLCYISKGMVLNSHERNFPGEFTLDDLLAERPDVLHTAPYVGSEDVDRYGVRRIRFLEYGPGLRAPDKISRPTFAELYDRPKLMVGEFGGFALDDGEWDEHGFLKCNHSVFLAVTWHLLRGVNNRSIRGELSTRSRSALERASEGVDPLYLLALLNSEVYRSILRAQERSAIRGRLQPDDLRALDIPIPATPVMEAVASAASAAVVHARALLELWQKSWIIEDEMIAAPTSVIEIPRSPLSSARVLWDLSIRSETSDVTSLRRVGRSLFRGRTEVLSVRDQASEDAVEWLRRQFSEMPEGTTMGSIIARDFEIPRSPTIAASALGRLHELEVAAAAERDALRMRMNEVEQILQSLVVEVAHAPVVQVRPQLVRR